MRHTGLLAICAVFTGLCAAGCGGGSGGNSSPAAVNGIWTGTFLQTRAAGDTYMLQVEFFQRGTTLNGTSVVRGVTDASVGTLTGTLNGNQMTASVADGSGNTVRLSALVSGSAITGTYTSIVRSNYPPGTGGAAGTFTLTRSAGVTTPNIAAITRSWGGDYLPGGSDQSLELQFTQNRNDLSFTGTTGSSGIGVVGGSHFTGYGAIIGNNVTLIAYGPATTYFFGTYNGAIIGGSLRDTQGKTGQFQVAPPQ